MPVRRYFHGSFRKNPLPAAVARPEIDQKPLNQFQFHNLRQVEYVSDKNTDSDPKQEPSAPGKYGTIKVLSGGCPVNRYENS
jgi:hypothetical protein